MGVNRKFQAKMPKYRNCNISETKSRINAKFEDHTQTINDTSWIVHHYLVTGARRRDHITPVLRQLHWLPDRQRVVFKIAGFMHESLVGASRVPRWRLSPFSDVGRCPLRTNSNDMRKLLVPRTHNKLGDRSFSAAGPRLWNDRNVATVLRLLQTFSEISSVWRLVTLSNFIGVVQMNVSIYLSIYLPYSKSNMADICHLEKWEDIIITQRMVRFKWNLVYRHKSKSKPFVSQNLALRYIHKI